MDFLKKVMLHVSSIFTQDIFSEKLSLIKGVTYYLATGTMGS